MYDNIDALSSVYPCKFVVFAVIHVRNHAYPTTYISTDVVFQVSVNCCAANHCQGNVCCAHSSCPFILANMAEEEVARSVVGNDSGTYKSCFAGDAPRGCSVSVGHDSGMCKARRSV